MVSLRTHLLRIGLAALLCGFAAPGAVAEPPPRIPATHRSDPTPNATRDDSTAPDKPIGPDESAPAGNPVLGMVWIVVGFLLLLLLVWAAVRVGDSDRPADQKMP